MNRLSNRKAWDSALPVQPRAAAPPFSGKKIETLLTGIAGPGGEIHMSSQGQNWVGWERPFLSNRSAVEESRRVGQYGVRTLQDMAKCAGQQSGAKTMILFLYYSALLLLITGNDDLRWGGALVKLVRHGLRAMFLAVELLLEMRTVSRTTRNKVSIDQIIGYADQFPR